MTSASAPDLWNVDDDVIMAATWFHDHGVHVFPTFNKEPALTGSQFAYRCSRAQASRFGEYGVPGGMRERYTDGLTIVDADKATTNAWVKTNLPDTPFTVTTGPYHDGSAGRGLHCYFRIRGPLPSSIHRDGLTIENRNAGLYVVGPGSVRPDGVVYRASAWPWRWDDIPFFPLPFVFDDGSCGRFSAVGTGEEYEFPEAVYAGDRHRELFRLLRSLKGSGIDHEMTRKIVLMANENRCHPPLVVKDARGEPDAKFEKWFSRGWNNRDRPFPSSAALLSGLREL